MKRIELMFLLFLAGFVWLPAGKGKKNGLMYDCIADWHGKVFVNNDWKTKRIVLKLRTM